MRLLNTSTLRLEVFNDAPKYAILSHTWEEDEVLFGDVNAQDPSAWEAKRGSQKVRSSCRQAMKEGYDYIWIDTCCIDKESSVELSEAINSMFKWYNESSVCYAYLSDISLGQSNAQCRYFTRGWTLQELIAPDQMLFFDRDWKFLCTRAVEAASLSQVTGIDERLLSRNYGLLGFPGISAALQGFSIATRMHWASKRSTTRPEDMAYSLMGIFNVNMPLLYGEGVRAFQRLQQEILKNSRDNSILGFTPDSHSYNILAEGPEDFLYDFPSVPISQGQPRMLVEEDELTLELLICPIAGQEGRYIAGLDCCIKPDFLSRPVIILRHIGTGSGGDVFIRDEQRILKINPGAPYLTFVGGDKPSSALIAELDQAKRIVVTMQRTGGLGIPWGDESTSPPLIFRVRSLVQGGETTYQLRRPNLVCPAKATRSFYEPTLYDGMVPFEDHLGHLFIVYWCGIDIHQGEERMAIDRPPRCKISFLKGFRTDTNPGAESGDPKLHYRLLQEFRQLKTVCSKGGSTLDISCHEDIALTEDGSQKITARLEQVDFLDRFVFELDIVIAPVEVDNDQMDIDPVTLQLGGESSSEKARIVH